MFISGLTKKGIIVIVVLSTAAFSMLCLFGAYVGYKKLAKAKEGKLPLKNKYN